MTYQRRRKGVPAIFNPITVATDSRGNKRKLHNPDIELHTKVWQFPQRGAKAEVTGQQTINVIRIGCTDELPGVELGSRVQFNGKVWDVVTPPYLHIGGGRHTRHYGMDVRERP